MNREQDRLNSNQNTSTVTRALPSILRQVKDNSVSILTNQLNEFFNSCDDLFFELANHAGSNNEQNLYFDSMREVRLKKTDVVNAFKDNFIALFGELTTNKIATKHERDDIAATQFESLDLVEDDKMEQEVAISSIVSKTRQDCQENLYHLNLRFDYLLKDLTVTEANLPLDPKQICECFIQAASLFELNIKARIILFKQFDRMVARHLNKIYSLANELLISAGILPKITPSVAKRQDQISASPDHVSDTQSGLADQDPVRPGETPANKNPGINYSFEQLSGLLQQVRASTSSPANVQSINTASRSHGSAISQDILIDQLNQLQRDPQLSQQPQSKEQLQTAIYQILQTTGEDGKPSSLHQSDEDVINLVSMFFEFILDDRNLPVPIQALISRLQIPILKVALKDKNFFNNSQHVARLLINEIASISIGWSESNKEQQDKLYELINDLIHQINDEFAGEISVFEAQLTKLRIYKQQEAKRAQIVESRTNQAAEGKAKTDQAKNLVQNILLQRLGNKELPETVSNFLIDKWQKVLLIVKLKSGDNSPEWLSNLQVVDDLVWAVQDHQDEKSQKRVTRIADKLFDSVAAGLKLTSTSEEAQSDTIESLKRSVPALSGVSATELPEEKSKLKVQQLAALGQAPDGFNKSWKEMSALERQKVKQQALQYEFLKKAESLENGTWFMYQSVKTAKQLRFKLASYIKENEHFIFVNRYGQKVAEKTKNEVALEMQRNLLTPLENGLLFDRAMSKIADNLKISQTTKAS